MNEASIVNTEPTENGDVFTIESLRRAVEQMNSMSQDLVRVRHEIGSGQINTVGLPSADLVEDTVENMIRVINQHTQVSPAASVPPPPIPTDREPKPTVKSAWRD